MTIFHFLPPQKQFRARRERT